MRKFIPDFPPGIVEHLVNLATGYLGRVCGNQNAEQRYHIFLSLVLFGEFLKQLYLFVNGKQGDYCNPNN